MESRFRVLFLIVAMISLSGCAATKNLFGFGNEEAPPLSAEEPGQVIDPQVERREIKEPKIDREDFEVGAYAGIMSIEDFGSNV
ncbi:MAG: outer membrane beta-barrel domain-containing protein, partial [Gammaproteobacteria bacterium]|nr:outer membrane beta-barrel domain-containing protein [Gammaproteobacteria bacterium]